MPEVRTIRNRGAFMIVEAHGEVLFTERSDVANFTRRLSNNARRFAAQEAPANKRPRWSHYGPSLKNSFRASTDADPARLRVDAAIGSTAHYAEFVDQGTKPFLAKILPPWAPRYPFLYEHTWVSPVTGERAGRIPVKGQRGRFFFEKGLHRAFLTAGMASAVVPFEPGRMATFPERLANFVGATPVDDAFKAQLDEWRAQRNAAWGAFVRDRDRPFRPTRSRATTSPERKKELSAARSRKYRRGAAYEANQKRKGRNTKDVRKDAERRRNLRSERTRFLNAMLKKYGVQNVDKGSLEFRNGYWYITVRVRDDRGRWIFKETRGKSTV